ncbi:hypothetical protein KIN20_028010 [Parelaphostrongylus tenuis]|uniref:Uncharacterized protein n=1 Tax=Parelaphostrongylus tenuis TaxID=148309 RepID=A0AAD5R0T3_PARTN|nr:hypothetical protein KIN20_028010 [Parelaphostrongylus tenuis]
MLKELIEAGIKIGLRINRTNTQFIKNSCCQDKQTNWMVLWSRRHFIRVLSTYIECGEQHKGSSSDRRRRGAVWDHIRAPLEETRLTKMSARGFAQAKLSDRPPPLFAAFSPTVAPSQCKSACSQNRD